MFSLARTALFIKPESQGRDCVQLSVISCTLLMPLCHMSFYLAAHQPPKSLCAYIMIQLRRDVLQNVHVSILHMASKLFQWLAIFMTTNDNFLPFLLKKNPLFKLLYDTAYSQFQQYFMREKSVKKYSLKNITTKYKIS